MAPFERVKTLSIEAQHVLSLIDVAVDSEQVKKTLLNLKKAEDQFIAPTLRAIKAADAWVHNPKSFETLLCYYLGVVRPLKALTLDIYALGGPTPESRAAWGKANKQLLRELTTHRLDSTVPVALDSEWSVITLMFQDANKELMARVAAAAPSYLTDVERKTAIAAGEGESWSNLFGGLTTPVGSALAYLMLQTLPASPKPISLPRHGPL